MFPLYKQHDSMQCGITCLQMICKHHGKEYSLESLSRQCFATTEGVSLLSVSEAANKLGLHTISRIKPTYLRKQDKFPSNPS